MNTTTQYVPYKVKDISLAEWGRKEIRLAEAEMGVKFDRRFVYFFAMHIDAYFARGEKVNLLVAMNDKAIEKGFKAGDLIRAIAPKVDGNGGGRPDMAQAGGKNPAGIPEALEAVKSWLMAN